MTRLTAAIVATALSGALLGCATASPTAAPSAAPTTAPTAAPTGAPSGATGAVNVTLQEWAVLPDPESAAAGDVTFAITNDGPDDAHEFVVIRTDLAPDALPTNENGSVDEEGDGIEVIDEVEEKIEPGATADLSVTLAPGNYVLICNVYDEEEQEAHYQMGMHTAFTVE